MSLMSQFLRKTDGNISLLFGLALIPMMAAAGVAVDYSNMSGTRSQIQSALDSAVLAGVVADTKDQVSVAKGMFGSNLSASIKIMSQTYTSGTDTLTGEASAEIPLAFGWIANKKTEVVTAKSTAKINILSTPAPSPAAGVACILVRNETESNTLIVNSFAKVIAPECEIHVKTKVGPSAIFNGGTTLDAKKFCIEGASVIQNMMTVKNLSLNCKTAADPFVGKYPKPATSCTYSSQNYFGAVTLNPGVYCGSFTFMGAVDVTLNPGVYVIQNGSWILNGAGKFSGNGVTIYFPDSSSIIFNGPIEANLKAPSTGSYKGVLIFEADGLAQSPFIINGSSSSQLEGLVYLPSRNMTFNVASVMAGNRMTLVVDKMIWNQTSITLYPYPDAAIAASGASNTAKTTKTPYLVY